MDVGAVTGSATASGVAHGAELVAFSDALVGEDERALAGARESLLAALGPAGLVDTAAVASNFERMVRIADGTGIPLDGPLRLASAGLREELGVGAFGSAHNTPTGSRLERWLGRAFGTRLLRLAFRPPRRPAPR